MKSEKPPLDVISEINESILDDDKSPPSAMERERNDIIKVKKVCKCSSDKLVHSMLSKLIGEVDHHNIIFDRFFSSQ